MFILKMTLSNTEFLEPFEVNRTNTNQMVFPI